MEEQELAGRCRQGDNLARKELYERYAGRMLSVCLRYAGDRDTAEDLMHDGFLKLFDSFDKFTWRGDGSLRAWMERVMVNNKPVGGAGQRTRNVRGTRCFDSGNYSSEGADAVYQ